MGATRVVGVGPVTAAMILGEVGNIARFPSNDHFASYTGTAPLDASSGDIVVIGGPALATGSSTTRCT
jgi:transposase